MRAVVATPEGPVLQEVPLPSPGAEEVLVRVRASALNRADLAMLKGAPHGRTGGVGFALGLEWAGEIVEIGRTVTRWRVGDRVMAASGGAFAEYAVGHERRLYAMPDGSSFEQAATLPVALQTMHDAIVTHGCLQAGQSVLVLGASAGVGLMGLQVARYLGAGRVLGTSTSPDRRPRLAEFGADQAIDTASADWVERVLEATDGRGVDLVIDNVSGALMNSTLRATRIGGRIVNVGRLGGMRGEFDFDLHALRRITYVGVTFRTRSAAEVEHIHELTTRDLLPAVAQGRLRLPIDRVYAFHEFADAFARMRGNAHFGKIVMVDGS